MNTTSVTPTWTNGFGTGYTNSNMSPWYTTPWGQTPWSGTPFNAPFSNGSFSCYPISSNTPWTTQGTFFGNPGFTGGYGYGPNGWWFGPQNQYGFNTTPTPNAFGTPWGQSGYQTSQPSFGAFGINPSWTGGISNTYGFAYPSGFNSTNGYGFQTPGFASYNQPLASGWNTPWSYGPFNSPNGGYPFTNFPTPNYPNFNYPNFSYPTGNYPTYGAFNGFSGLNAPLGFGGFNPFNTTPWQPNAYNNFPQTGYGTQQGGFGQYGNSTPWAWHTTPSFGGYSPSQSFEPGASVNPFGVQPISHNVNGMPANATCGSREAA